MFTAEHRIIFFYMVSFRIINDEFCGILIKFRNIIKLNKKYNNFHVSRILIDFYFKRDDNLSCLLRK